MTSPAQQHPTPGTVLSLIPGTGAVEFVDRVDNTDTFHHPIVGFALVATWTEEDGHGTAISPVVVTGTEVTTADQLVEQDEDYGHTYWQIADPLLDRRPLPRAMREPHEEVLDGFRDWKRRRGQ